VKVTKQTVIFSGSLSSFTLIAIIVMARETLSEKEAFAQSLLTPIESYVIWFQDFLIWKKPLLSAGILLFVHAFFW
jgi:hypothetical protein